MNSSGIPAARYWAVVRNAALWEISLHLYVVGLAPLCQLIVAVLRECREERSAGGVVGTFEVLGDACALCKEINQMNEKKPTSRINEHTSAEELVQELARDPAVTLAEERVRFHVYMGRGHGYPDCCIRTYVRAGGADLPGEDKQLASFVGRRLCDDCKARALEVADAAGVKGSRKLEAWLSETQFCILQIAYAHTRESPNQERIQYHRDELEKCIEQVVRIKKAEKSGASSS